MGRHLIRFGRRVQPAQGDRPADIGSDLLTLDHCGQVTFDGRTVMVNGGSPPRAASTLLLARYRGLSLSGGGDNVRHAWSSPGEPPLTVFLALDEATPFYKLAPAEDGTAASWTARLWTGRQLDSGALAVTYTRPWRDAAGFAHMEETHRVTVHQGVPVRAAPAQPCE